MSKELAEKIRKLEMKLESKTKANELFTEVHERLGKRIVKLQDALEATTNPIFHGLDCEQWQEEEDERYCECHILEAERALEKDKE